MGSSTRPRFHGVLTTTTSFSSLYFHDFVFIIISEDSKSILCHSQVTRESLLKLLCPSCVIYESPSDIRPICEGFVTDIRASPELATREKFPDRFEPFHAVGELVPSDGESPELLRVFRSRLRPSDK